MHRWPYNEEEGNDELDGVLDHDELDDGEQDDGEQDDGVDDGEDDGVEHGMVDDEVEDDKRNHGLGDDGVMNDEGCDEKDDGDEKCGGHVHEIGHYHCQNYCYQSC